MIRHRDILSRKFAFARLGNWWFSKIPPLLAVGYLAIGLEDFEFGHATVLLASFLLSVSCVAVYGHIINDIFDIDEDRRAGKPNSMADLGRSSRWSLALAYVCAGFLPAIVVGYSAVTVVLLGVNYLWPTIYSLPGIRLKERGVLGVICDALGSHVTPTLFALALFGATSSAAPSGHLALALMITLWAAVLGIKGILHHQIIDRDNDTRSGAVTFATTVSPNAIARFLTLFNLWIELPVSIALVFVVYRWCPLAAGALAAYCLLETIKYGLGIRFPLGSDLRVNRTSVPFANELFYVLWLPLAAAVQLAAHDRAWAWLPVLHAVMFYQPLLLQVRELGSVAKIATRPYRRRILGPRK
jgi:4-hydroxybenzoate polyprenyltransferase